MATGHGPGPRPRPVPQRVRRHDTHEHGCSRTVRSDQGSDAPLPRHRRSSRGPMTLVAPRRRPHDDLNHAPLDPAMIADEVTSVRDDVASDLFTGSSSDTFPDTSVGALRLVAAAYRDG